MTAASSLIVGVDLASQPTKTAAVWFERIGGTVAIGYVAGGVDNECLGEWLDRPSAVLGIDAPFGWPQPFVDQLRWWHEGAAEPGPLGGLAGRPQEAAELVAYRATDRFVRKHVGIRRDRSGWPQGLSVSTNLISYTTLRLTAVLDGRHHVDRAGTAGPLLEVYPAAALAQWSQARGSYKPAGKSGAARVAAEARREELGRWVGDQLREAVPAHSGLGELTAAMSGNDDLLDAGVAAMCAWAALAGCAHVPDPTTGFAPTCAHVPDPAGWAADFWEQERERRSGIGEVEFLSLARSEGWIHHPSCLPHQFLHCDPWAELERRVA